MESSLGSSGSSDIIGSLHAILKPFLLRRLKADVDLNLPPKKEYVLYAPLSMAQRETYDHILDGTLRAHLLGDAATPEEKSEEEKVDVDMDAPIQLRKRSGKKWYTVDGDDDEYFDMLENGEIDERGLKHEAEKLKPGEAYKKYERRVKSKILSLRSEAPY
jgi:ATP-dependent DNA helicase